ncbi:MAG: MerR family DNA-binding transcriptional regulator [Pseudooceanicola sp.]|nr:MerR family DNA-binding transcriptional regulator [Pseudooceanicola sp.]
MAEGELSFKEMCAKFEVTPRTLRYYEYIELLQPRRDGRARWYGPRELARMTLILRGRRFGFPLEDIRQWLEIHDSEGSEAQTRVWIQRADAQLVELQRQREELDQTIQELKALRDESVRQLQAMSES